MQAAHNPKGTANTSMIGPRIIMPRSMKNRLRKRQTNLRKLVAGSALINY